MIREPLGGFSNIKTSQVFEPYKFNTKQSLPWVKPKRAQNIPEVYYDSNGSTEKIVNQIAVDNYNEQVRESFSNIGYTPKVMSNIYTISSKINEPKKVGFSPKVLTSIQTQTSSSGMQTETPIKNPFLTSIGTPFYTAKEEKNIFSTSKYGKPTISGTPSKRKSIASAGSEGSEISSLPSEEKRTSYFENKKTGKVLTLIKSPKTEKIDIEQGTITDEPVASRTRSAKPRWK